MRPFLSSGDGEKKAMKMINQLMKKDQVCLIVKDLLPTYFKLYYLPIANLSSCMMLGHN